MQTNNPEFEYWNNDGGQRWIRYIDRLETVAGAFNQQLYKGAAVQSGERVLDVGCGGGPTSAAFAESAGANGQVLGVDISDVILAVARQRYTNVANLQFETADAGTHHFPADSFDVAASRFGVMFFPEPEKAFANIQRALKPGGRLCMVCWRGIDENPWMGVPTEAAFGMVPRPEPSPNGPGPFSLRDPDTVHEILTAANFEQIRFVKIDEKINLGSVDEALKLFSDFGPAAASIKEASPSARERALAAIAEVLEQHRTPAGVVFAGATWLVRARVAGSSR